MSIIFDRNDIWVAPNEILYTTVDPAHMRGRTLLTQNEMKYIGE